MQIVNSYLIWGGIALHYAHEFSACQQEKHKCDFFTSIIRLLISTCINVQKGIQMLIWGM